MYKSVGIFGPGKFTLACDTVQEAIRKTVGVLSFMLYIQTVKGVWGESPEGWAGMHVDFPELVDHTLWT